ncbi:secreted protein [Candidatus Magnetobacterium bavaricum]|uniref:Secreted protein n=1 Tax=Candidatus Magnetobacterium bavaricum TaxID=29290 RepID=A0A0F3GPD7_9BACT|nr:secreted protein [Candidatus Magnetobacterium bavaricum]
MVSFSRLDCAFVSSVLLLAMTSLTFLISCWSSFIFFEASVCIAVSSSLLAVR